jgi:oligopeptide/dipeptide ABC transporter ATP-binding protein
MESGPAHEIIHAPRHPYTQGLLAAIPQLETGAARQPLKGIPGQPPSLAGLALGCPFRPRCAFARPDCAVIPVTLDRNLPDHGSACPFVN